MTQDSPLLSTVTKRAKAIQLATKEVRYLYAKHQVKDVLIIKNSLSTAITLNLFI
jgi:hypothetical protein